MQSNRTGNQEGIFLRRWTRHEGLFFDEFSADSAWIRNKAKVYFPSLPKIKQIVIRGEYQRHPEVGGIEEKTPRLDIYLNDNFLKTIAPTQPGLWEFTLPVPPDDAARGIVFTFILRKVALTNFLAWLGRVGQYWPKGERLQRFRRQNKNRQLRVSRIEADGELVYDFSNRHAPYSPIFARKHASIGMNIVGFLTAELGVGQSARCMMRAADSTKIPAAAVALKLPCKARLGDHTYAAYLRDSNPYAVNVFHLDAPGGREIDHHHGPGFRAQKYNIGYWAWELPEFPDAWIPYFDYFDEIWCPSEFVRTAIAAKSPLPVITMPHAMEFERPKETAWQLRAKLGLPPDVFLFLFLYDLNSYSERKNPRAVIEAFRQSGLASKGAMLVIKIHGVKGNEQDLADLRAALGDLPGMILLTEPLTRAGVYELEAACDCFVSLHRSEGFGLAIAECMYLGKPVIATNWSAPAEYLNESNGAPVRYRLVTLDRNHGPYSKGQTWADPDLFHAAEWMQRLATDRALGLRLGEAARATIERLFSNEAIGARYQQRLEAIASW